LAQDIHHLHFCYFSSTMVKLLRCVALAVVVDQAQSALQCLGGYFTLQGDFAPEFATATGYEAAMKNAVITMSGSSTISADHVTASIVIGTDAPAAGDCAAAIAASPAPTLAPADSSANTTAAPGEVTAAPGEVTAAPAEVNPNPPTPPAPPPTLPGDVIAAPSTGPAAPSTGPSLGPARLLEDSFDFEGRQLGAHTNNGASVSYTVVADSAIMGAIETSIGGSSSAEVLAAVNSALTDAVAADTALVTEHYSVTSASAPMQVDMVMDTRTAAPPASTGEDSFASKSFCSLVGLTLAATSILV